jgi:hypothetical protein
MNEPEKNGFRCRTEIKRLTSMRDPPPKRATLRKNEVDHEKHEKLENLRPLITRMNAKKSFLQEIRG